MISRKQKPGRTGTSKGKRPVVQVTLKRPIESYEPRYIRFIQLLADVKDLPPKDRHLWEVMDGVAFQDTETALETTLVNAGETPVTETVAMALQDQKGEAFMDELDKLKHDEFKRGFRAGKAAANDD